MIDSLEEFNIKVCDFGISGIFCKNNTDQTLAGIILNNLGSPKYMSPEVLTDKSPAKPSMDIWSMGIILYRILHGYFPFQAETCKELFELIKKGEYSFDGKIKSSVSRCCLEFIDSML